MSKWLNYQHLYYFWRVARAGTVTGAAIQLRLSQPTLSAQIKLLEEQLDLRLFEKDGRKLKLTSAGRVTFETAEQIFSLGKDLIDRLDRGELSNLNTFKVGVSDVIPKTLAYRILEPLFSLPNSPKLVCFENDAPHLLADLTIGELDLVISDSAVPTTIKARLFSHVLGTSGISLLAAPKIARKLKVKKPHDLADVPMLLPSRVSALRQAIDGWLDSHGVSVNIVGDFQDSALMKIFGREAKGTFPVPSAIEKEICRELNVTPVFKLPIFQTYYLIARERRLANPIIAHLYEAAKLDLFSR